MKFSNKAAVIIGSGIAGLYTAIKLSEKVDREILIITKSNLRESNSRYAQGGIVGILPENLKDSVELHVQDTSTAGAGLTNSEVAEFISERSEKAIRDLIQYGVEFDRDEKNNLSLTLEGAHSARRILHSGGDATGRSIELALCAKVENAPNISIYRQTQAVDLLVDSENNCKGVIAFNTKTNEYETVYSPAVIIATGGIGQVYSNTTNPRIATGDGIALAYKAGAVMQNMEFVQFHPTALNIEENNARFLISESVRGEGAKLRTPDGEFFTTKYDKRGDLAPRDVVTRAIISEMQEKGLSYVNLDVSDISRERFAKRFPNIMKACLDHGIDIFKSGIPVSPAAHYLMGGIKTDVYGRTSLRGLYAVGEVACTGFHGANRLASNSLLECVVIANELANYLVLQPLESAPTKDCKVNCFISKYEQNIFDFKPDVSTLRKQLRDTMWQKAGIIRDEDSLKESLREINEFKLEFNQQNKCRNNQEYEFRNLLIVAEIIVRSALNRKESRGGHYRSDYPETDEHAYNSIISRNNIEVSLDFSPKNNV